MTSYKLLLILHPLILHPLILLPLILTIHNNFYYVTAPFNHHPSNLFTQVRKHDPAEIYPAPTYPPTHRRNTLSIAVSSRPSHLYNFICWGLLLSLDELKGTALFILD
jgi:hypothetical protein